MVVVTSAVEVVVATVVVVTSADLLLGRFARRDGYAQLRKLGIDRTFGFLGHIGAIELVVGELDVALQQVFLAEFDGRRGGARRGEQDAQPEGQGPGPARNSALGWSSG